jgi:membrane fusion protein, multidrug efflux system
VEVKSDLYGSSVTYHGTVVGLSGGTGSTFAAIPAQNATGNWIKVVQRVPVRVELNAKQLAEHPLRVGLSMEATVDIAEQGGQPLAAAGNMARSNTTQAFDAQTNAADRMVHDIIAANLGRGGATRVSGAKPSASVAMSQPG